MHGMVPYPFVYYMRIGAVNDIGTPVGCPIFV